MLWGFFFNNRTFDYFAKISRKYNMNDMSCLTVLTHESTRAWMGRLHWQCECISWQFESVWLGVFSESNRNIFHALLKEDISRNSDLLIRLVYVVILQLSMSLLNIQAGKKWALCSGSMWTQWLLSSVHLAEGNQTGQRHGGNWTTYLCKTHYIMWDITHTHSLSHAV